MLDTRQRKLFTELSNVILPGNLEQPAARDIDIADKPLDLMLRSRPDLEQNLLEQLRNYDDATSKDALSYIQSLEITELRNLILIVCATYYMHPVVKQNIGYSGQQAIPLGRGGFGAEELVMEMMEKPKTYRCTD
jgi:hypothetical protein